ncbi:efflux RND transporter permease subunit [Crateriforma conspicua]|uniref:MMPL family protein n=1 Tax=Crateriforma conspicua TaxID=2527996 RepID=A0A5C5XS34_9PLAN|nr:MMPL family transporter [Crateriforma conspicua]TWT65468.1 MMPL family protein [Crateriforma conspicua]
MKGSTNRRRFKIILLYLLLLSPWIGMGAIGALKPVANSPLDWVDDKFAPRADYDAFSKQFGAADVVVISWQGCTIDNANVDRFTQSLRESSAFFEGDQWLFHRVVSGRDMYRMFSQPQMGLSDNDARDRIAGSLLGPDHSTTSVVIAFNEDGLRQRSRLVPMIRAAATKYGGADYTQQHLAGPIMDGYAVDEASQTTMSRYAPLSSIIVFCVCVLCLDSFYAACIVFGMSCISQLIALAILHLGGGEMTALLIVLPPLIQVLAIAGGIHLVNYTLDAAEETGQQTAVAKAVRIGWLPCVLSSTTTAIGLGSLAVSGLAAVREFGVFAALGVLATVCVLLVLLPGFLSWRPIRTGQPVAKDRFGLLWTSLIKLQTKHASLVTVVAAIGIIGLGIGVTRLQASVRIETLFGTESRLMSDYAWLEENVGPLVPIEAVVTIPMSSNMDAGQQFALFRTIEQRLAESPHVTAVTSCLDFLPESPFPIEGEFGNRLFQQSEAGISNAGYLNTSSNAKHWRLTAHVSALGDLNYGDILREMQDSLAEDSLDDPTDCYTVKLSGLMPLVHEIQRQLLRDLFASFLTAFVLIAIVMTIVQAGIFAGVLSMVPNVFPALALFGFLGWIDHPIDIGSIMTASVAMGIAVDDTLHFLTFFTRRLDEGSTRTDAVLAAYEHCGRAMIQTTLICGTGLAIFALSDFVPTARFAWMMIALLTFAIIGDLLVLPAILLSPLGKAFDRR